MDGLFGIQTGQTLTNLGEVRGNIDVLGTLTGSGSQNGIVYLQPDGHIAPGNGVGTLNFASGLEFSDGAVLDFQLGNMSDLLRVLSGTFFASGLAGVTANFLTGPSFTPGKYTLIDWTGSTAVGIDASDFKTGILANGMQAEYRVVNETVRVNIVPEPGSLVLMGCGFIGLLGSRRCRS